MKAWVWQDEYDTDMGLQFDITATGFKLRGREVVRYCEINDVNLLEGDVLHGVASDIHALDIPQIPDYPESLECFCLPHRRLTLAEARKGDFPFFIKPVEHKEFSGFVAKRPLSLGCIEGNPDVWVGDVVDLRSEWRVYIRHQEVVKVCHYKGSPAVFPDEDRIRSMIYAWEKAPAAYALDVAVLEDSGWEQRTVLVETNDMFCLGNYGVDSCDFASMLEARWSEVWEGGFNA